MLVVHPTQAILSICSVCSNYPIISQSQTCAHTISNTRKARRRSKYLKSVSICLSAAFRGSILLTPDPPSSTRLNPNTTGLMASLRFPAGLTYRRGESGTVWFKRLRVPVLPGPVEPSGANPFPSPQLPFFRRSPNPAFMALFALLSWLMLSSVSLARWMFMRVCVCSLPHGSSYPFIIDVDRMPAVIRRNPARTHTQHRHVPGKESGGITQLLQT